MRDLCNLLVDLRGPEFGEDAFREALRTIEAEGYAVDIAPRDDAFLAWIDGEFGGAWSSEAALGSNLLARKRGAFAGFATYGARGIPYAWLRGLGGQPDVGIFGPFGVGVRHRGSLLGRNLLRAALAALRREGFTRALIPAIGETELVEYYARHAGAQVAERYERAAWSMPRRTVVLASGSGTNFQSVIDGVTAGDLPLELALLLSNKPQAFALTRARDANIAAVALPWDRKAQSRAAYDGDLAEMVRREEPELVLLLGWMHVLDDRFVSEFRHIINIHPAFLPLDQHLDRVTFEDGTVTPAFRGAHAVRDALTWGSSWVGASPNRVTAETDRGPVLVRKPLRLAANEAQDAIMERLHPMEHAVLAAGIKRWIYER